MRSLVPTSLLSAVLVLAAVPLYADLTFTLDSSTGSGSPTNASPDPGFCIQPNCVLFNGTLLDTDTDGSYIFLNSNSPFISVSFSSSPAGGSLSLDNTFYNDVPFVLSGDPTWESDLLGNPSNIYGPNAPIFGIDIAPGTTVGVYDGTVTIYAEGGTNDPNFSGFSVTRNFTVDVVTPEPTVASLLLVGMPVLAACWVIKRKWRSSEPLR